MALLLCLAPMAAIHAGTQVIAWGSNANTNGWGVARLDLTNVVAIAAGYRHNLALTSDGRVLAWGNDEGLTNMPSPLTNVLAVAAGFAHSLALKDDGTVIAWGRNNEGEAIVPPGLTSVVAIAAGAAHSVALKDDGTVVAWGDSSYGETDVPSDLTNVVAISGGDYYSLALKDDGTVVMWGNGNTNAGLPVPRPPIVSGVVAIAAGRGSLALRQDGTVIFWGTWGLPDLTNIVAVAVGCNDINLVLRADGTVDYWYDDDYFINPGGPPPWLTNVTAISTKGWPGDGLALIGDSPPVLSVPVLNLAATHDTFRFSVPTRSGRVYAVEFKNSLADAQWIPALPLLAGNGRIRTFTYEIAAQRFYRVRQW
jgi:alpha-tubulin suppressor-like RCC1 family protein